MHACSCNNHNEMRLWSKRFPTWCNQFYLSSWLANQKNLCYWNQQQNQNTFEVISARGIHAALPLAKPVSRSLSLQDATATETLEPSLSVSFRYVMSHKSEVVEEGLTCIQSYIERNTSFIFQKALLSSSFLPQCLMVVKFSKHFSKCTTFLPEPFEGGLVLCSEVISSLSPTSMMCQMKNLSWSCHPMWEDIQNGCHWCWMKISERMLENSLLTTVMLKGS